MAYWVKMWMKQRPLLGYYDTGDIDITEWHIKWAVEYRIDTFYSPFSADTTSNATSAWLAPVII